nr:putative abc transporter atp-binding protein [Quercus suber]
MKRPELVIIDGPYMGLDPLSRISIDKALRNLSKSTGIGLVLGFTKDYNEITSWLTDLVAIKPDSSIFYSGAYPPLEAAGFAANPDMDELLTGVVDAERLTFEEKKGKMATVSGDSRSRDGFSQSSPPLPPGEAVVKMQGVRVSYGDKTVLGDWSHVVDGEHRPGLWWSLHRGQRYGIFGPNGSGKTTMLSLITSDHPQTYSLPIEIFGRSRLPGPGQPGISLFDIQKRMGHSSPEVHAFFPKQLTVRRALESAWADAPLARPRLTKADDGRVSACLRWFAKELNPRRDKTNETAIEKVEAALARISPNYSLANKVKKLREIYDVSTVGDKDIEWAYRSKFGELSFSNQRLVLFLRAIVAEPDLVILDEAFSGMDASTRDRALLFLSQGERVSQVGFAESEQAFTDSQVSALATIGEVKMRGLSPEQALLTISHSRHDVPGCVREWICLPEPGEGRVARTGVLQGPLELNPAGWDDIWGTRLDTDPGNTFT